MQGRPHNKYHASYLLKKIKHDAKGNKPVTKGQILDDCTYEVPRGVKFIEAESRMVVARGWGME